MFTPNSCTIYFDGVVAKDRYFESPGDGSWIEGCINNYGDDDWLIKDICLGGNQAWDRNDNDAPLKFANFRIQNNAMTADQIATQMAADKAEATAVSSVAEVSEPQKSGSKVLKDGKLTIETNAATYTAGGALMK